MFSVNMTTRECDGHMVVVLCGELDVADAGGDLLLAAPRREVLRVLTLTRLIDVFPVHASVKEAAGHARRTAAAMAGRAALAVTT